MVLTERQKQILTATVQTYILTGDPVGSKMLCDVMPVQVSSATIRNVLSDLCDMGFLTQPHTSAGRIPTAMGYRFYIEQLMNENRLTDEQKHRIDSLLGSVGGSTEAVLEQACESLASLTGCAAVITTPCDKMATLKKVQLIAISRKTVMAVIATSSGMIKNRVVRCDMNVGDEQLQNAQNALCKVMVGKSIDDISIATTQQIIGMLGADMLLLSPIVAAAVEAVLSAAETELTLKGESNLLINNGFSGEGAARLLGFLQNRESLMHMIRRPQSNISVVLGDETGEDVLHSSGVIIANYKLHGRDIGSIGVLGPERMDYGKIIPGMMYFRDVLQKLLDDSISEDND